MTNITIRNIPDDIINKIKVLSETERRSLNSEILVILEKGLITENNQKNNSNISKETQIKIWSQLSGKWKDDRSTKEIIDDIYQSRTEGREFIL
jgi:plasmid stability protein